MALALKEFFRMGVKKNSALRALIHNNTLISKVEIGVRYYPVLGSTTWSDSIATDSM